MRKIILLKGLPGSGKTTYAKELMAKNPGQYQRINKDLLREMLHFSVYNKQNERITLDIRNVIINHIMFIAIDGPTNIIIDDTNFNSIHQEKIQNFIKEYNKLYLAEYVLETKFIDTPIEECILRDSQREKPVGEKVIRDMAEKYLNKDPEIRQIIIQDNTLPPCIICDIDGTIADNTSQRSPYDTTNVYEDEPKLEVINIIKELWKDNVLFFFSGRDEICEKETYRWLIEKAGFENGFNLCMRKHNDKRRDTIVKLEMYNEHIKDKCFVKLVIDDRLRICRLWHQLGFNIFRVGNPDADF